MTFLFCKKNFLDDYCYWGTGKSYRGVVKTSVTGRPCLPWINQFNLQISDYPELAGRHSYCRNPGSTELQPWCYVDLNNRTQKELCYVPKCGGYHYFKLIAKKNIVGIYVSYFNINFFFLVENLWVYAVVGFVLIAGFLIILVCYCCCYKSKKSRGQSNNNHLPMDKV